MTELLDDLACYKDAVIDCTHSKFEVIRDTASQCLRVLSIEEDQLYEHVLKGSIPDYSIVAIVEDTPQLRDRLTIVDELKTLYEQLRLLKLEGRVYEVLDKFFNEQLYRTL
jgi:hypothetical protein